MSGKYRCPLCLAPMHLGRCADLDVLVCVNCGKTVETAVADVACVVAQDAATDGVRFTPGGDVFVPTTNPRESWRGYGHVVSRGSCLTCGTTTCRHAKAARAFLQTLSPSPDGVTPAPQTTPSHPVSAARPSGRAGRA